MDRKLELIKATPREDLLKTIQEKQIERERELAAEKQVERERRVRERQRNLARAVKEKERRAEQKIEDVKTGLAQELKNLAREYFHLNRTELEIMPKAQYTELAELIAYTAKKRLAFQLILLPVMLPLSLSAWALRTADEFLDGEGASALGVIGLFTAIVFGFILGFSALDAGHKIAGSICIAVGLTPWSLIISGLALKLTNKIKPIGYFSEKMRDFECFGGLKYLYYRSQAKKALGPAGLVKFLEIEARS